MNPIVVGIDGSASSSAALRWAAGMASATGIEVVLATVVPTAADREQAEKLLEEEWSVPARSAEVTWRPWVAEGDPRQRLGEFAAESDAGLLVVGAGHERWFPALHLGSVSHHLAHHLERPLCVVPAGRSGFEPGRVVVGLDGSPGSAAAAKWCKGLALAAGGCVEAVYAWQHYQPLVSAAAGPCTGADAQSCCRRWGAELGEAGVLAECRAEEGGAAQVLAAAVTGSGAGLLVLGARGAGGFSGLRLGGVALRLLQAGLVPTVLVPAA